MINKKEGFREGKAEEIREQLRASLTKEELLRIDETRKFDAIERDSPSFHLVLYQDQLKIALRKAQFEIEKILWNIDNLSNQISRAEFQLTSKNIIETLGESGMIMNEEELITHIKYMQWAQKGEVIGLPKSLMQVRGVVGTHDIDKNPILTEDEFNEYVQKIDEEVQEKGFKLFG